MAGKKKSAARRNRPRMAESADRFALYEAAVQDADVEMEFVADIYRKTRGRDARLLREDFCGSGWAACEWVQRHRQNRAFGVDLDETVLEWGRQRHWQRLSPATRERVQLIHGDVLDTSTEKVDITVAMNFSYWIFKERATLLKYFRAVHRGLGKDGMFLLDAYGGYEAFRDEYVEKRRCKGFTYEWEQASYDPISGDYVCHINFRFSDGSAIKPAFTYEWRLWTLPEIRELLLEAGFSKVAVWWQEDEDGDYAPVERGSADPAWICYLAAEA